MTIKLQSNGAYSGAKSTSEVFRALAQGQAAIALDGASVTDLTDSSGGTAADAIALPKHFTATAVDGTNLAGKASTETALGLVVDGLLEVMATANACATGIGIATVTDNSGGTAANDTIAAMTVAVTGAATGAQVTESNAVLDALNNYAATAVELVNSVCASVGVSKLQLTGLGDAQSPVAAVSTGTGTAAAANAVSKADMDAALVAYANAVASMAARLTSANAVSTKPKVLAV